MFKVNDIVKVIHYESKFAGLLGEIREITGDSAYVEFNDANGDSQDGQIISLSWLEWIYSPNGWKKLMGHTSGEIASQVVQNYGYSSVDDVELIHKMIKDGVLIERGELSYDEF